MEEEFSEEAFAIELATEEDFPEDYPLSYKEIAYRQKKDRKLLKDAADHPDQHVKKPCTFSDKTCEQITKNDKTHVPRQRQAK